MSNPLHPDLMTSSERIAEIYLNGGIDRLILGEARELIDVVQVAGSGAVTLGDKQASGEQYLVVACEPCHRNGRYSVARLIEQHGKGARLPDLLAFLSRSCDQPSAPGARRLRAVYAGLPHRKVV